MERFSVTDFDTTLRGLDWVDICTQLDAEGYAVLPRLLGADAAHRLARHIPAMGAHRVILESSGLGRGDLFYFDAGC